MDSYSQRRGSQEIEALIAARSAEALWGLAEKGRDWAINHGTLAPAGV